MFQVTLSASPQTNLFKFTRNSPSSSSTRWAGAPCVRTARLFYSRYTRRSPIFTEQHFPLASKWAQYPKPGRRMVLVENNNYKPHNNSALVLSDLLPFSIYLLIVLSRVLCLNHRIICELFERTPPSHFIISSTPTVPSVLFLFLSSILNLPKQKKRVLPI